MVYLGRAHLILRKRLMIMNKPAEISQVFGRGLLAAIVAIVILYAFKSHAHICGQREAQVQVTVSNILPLTQPGLVRYCLAHFTLSNPGSIYNPSAMCPIDVEDAAVSGFLIKKIDGQTNCKYKAGDIVSGVLTQDAETNGAPIILDEGQR